MTEKQTHKPSCCSAKPPPSDHMMLGGCSNQHNVFQPASCHLPCSTWPPHADKVTRDWTGPHLLGWLTTCQSPRHTDPRALQRSCGAKPHMQPHRLGVCGATHRATHAHVALRAHSHAHHSPTCRAWRTHTRRWCRTRGCRRRCTACCPARSRTSGPG